jgi:hypothetical protein
MKRSFSNYLRIVSTAVISLAAVFTFLNVKVDASSLDTGILRDENGSGTEDLFDPSAELTDDLLFRRLDALREQFPDGRYWNHVGKDTDDMELTTDKPCPNHNRETTCNHIKAGDGRSYCQCAGFSVLLSKKLYGSDFTGWKLIRVTDLADETILPGDVIRYGYRVDTTGHTMLVLGISGDNLRVVDCNGLGANAKCGISWDHVYSLNAIKSRLSMSMEPFRQNGIYRAPRPLPFKDGMCGDKASYTIDGSGTLTITGTGYVDNRFFENNTDIKKIVIANGITGLGYRTFAGCTALKEVVLPDSLTDIYRQCFYGCEILEKIDISKVTTIGKDAFFGCKDRCGNDCYYELKNGVLTISGKGEVYDSAFKDNETIKKVVIKEGITGLGNNTFRECSSLTEVLLPESLSTIGEACFAGCASMEKMDVPSSVTTIGKNAFYKCRTFCGTYCRYTLEDGVMTISGEGSLYENVFSGDDSIEKLIVNEGITQLSKNTFGSCTSLREVVLPQGLKKIGNSCFYRCKLLEKVNMPKTVSIIESGAFDETKLKKFTPDPGVTATPSVDAYGTGYCGDNVVWAVEYDNYISKKYALVIRGDGEMYDFEQDKTPWKEYTAAYYYGIFVEEGVQSIGDYAFFNSGAPDTTIDLPSSVTRIGKYAFKSINVVFAENSKLKIIDDCAFSNVAISELILPEGVEYIGKEAFMYTGLTMLSIPSTVRHIGEHAFYPYYGDDVNIYADPRGLEWVINGESDFNYISSRPVKIHVYNQYLENYKTLHPGNGADNYVGDLDQQTAYSAFKGYSVSLNDGVNLNIHMKLRGDVAASSSTYLAIYPSGYRWEDSIANVSIKDAKKVTDDGKTIYVFSCKLDPSYKSQKLCARIVSEGRLGTPIQIVANDKVFELPGEGFDGVYHGYYNQDTAPAYNALRVGDGTAVYISSRDDYYGDTRAYVPVLFDSNMRLSITDDDLYIKDRMVDIEFTLSGKDKGKVNKLAVMIISKEYSRYNIEQGRIEYFETMDLSYISDNKASVWIPSQYNVARWGRDFYIYLIAVCESENYDLSYASAPVMIPQPIDPNTNRRVYVTQELHGRVTVDRQYAKYGEKVTIKAEPDEGYVFSSWNMTAGDALIEDIKGAETTLTIQRNEVSIKGIFKVKPAVTPSPTPSVTPVPSENPEPTQPAEPTNPADPTKAPKITLTLDKSSANVICGQDLTFKATLKGSDAKISWSSSDAKIATVDANGKVHALKAGMVTVTASAAGKKAKCSIQVLFKDVANENDFWYKPTYYLANKDIVKGYDNQTTFKPANECTRAQMMTFMYRLAGNPATKASTCNFEDVKSTDYFYKPVIWAVEQGITTGVSKTSFNPQGACTRAQTVTFLWRMAGKPEPAKNAKKFSDVKSTDYFYKATLWASGKKILAGYEDGTFKPQGKCLRRQMVTFLYKYDKYVNGKG